MGGLLRFRFRFGWSSDSDDLDPRFFFVVAAALRAPLLFPTGMFSASSPAAARFLSHSACFFSRISLISDSETAEQEGSAKARFMGEGSRVTLLTKYFSFTAVRVGRGRRGGRRHETRFEAGRAEWLVGEAPKALKLIPTEEGLSASADREDD